MKIEEDFALRGLIAVGIDKEVAASMIVDGCVFIQHDGFKVNTCMHKRPFIGSIKVCCRTSKILKQMKELDKGATS